MPEEFKGCLIHAIIAVVFILGIAGISKLADIIFDDGAGRIATIVILSIILLGLIALLRFFKKVDKGDDHPKD